MSICDFWVPVVGWIGLYEVSEYGAVRSCSRVISRGKYEVLWKGGYLKPREHSSGYLRVQLSREGEAVDVYIHRIVSEAFHANLENKDYVNHKDGNKKNNHKDNLEWVTPVENSEHAYETGLAKRNLLTVLDPEGKILYTDKVVGELVKMGYTQSAISRCLSGKLRTHKGCTFKIQKESN